VSRAPACVPTVRAVPRSLPMNADSFLQVFPFNRFGNIAVFNPLQTMAGDFPVRFLHGGDLFRAARQGCRHSVNRDREAAAREYAPQAPEASARAVLVHALDIHMSAAWPGMGSENV